MMPRVPALLLLVPLEQREIQHPAELEGILRDQVHAPRDFLPELVHRGLGDDLLVGDEEEQVARPGAHGGAHLRLDLRGDELGDRRIEAGLLDADPGQAFRAETADVLGQFVQPAPRQLAAARRADSEHFAACAGGGAEHLELALRGEFGHVVELHAIAQVGLVGAVSGHRFGVAEPPERRPNLASEQFAEEARHHPFDQRK